MSSVAAAMATLLFLVLLSQAESLAGIVAALPAFVAIGGGIAFGHFILLGLPIYLLLSRRFRVPIWACALAGAVIGALPFSILVMLLDPPQASLDDPEIWWPELAALLAGAGAVGGAIFGRMMRPFRADEAP